MIAAENGNDYAEYQLGKIYLYGKDVPRDTDKAMYYLHLAAEHGNQYAAQLIHGILEKYPPEWKEETPAPSDADGGGQAQQDSPKNEPQRTQPKSEKRGGSPIRTSPPKKETAPDITEAEIIKDLTETEVQSNEPS